MTIPRQTQPKRATLYLRVSTGDQELRNQRPELEQRAHVRGLDIAAVYQEQRSAVKVRPQFNCQLDHGRRPRR